ncbi:tRNA modification GTPase MnmE [Propionispora sp. 2/2-37]|uniref:tRNA uridine-5-carboxymethylaminomethyl(34) synthesis GTPase MnmE n=1 Tax=Propionispora sp. 2/2-37 TaxID=1677858 RepID=UPI0006BB5A53|nr:tRNA uridine-5-carboxymethylaminomethyl(34) synthesis GTPase MnmE [Propionispora sp. 2/2-37]CUH95772.1 tRNA modification GTPase MnmE [Propionispora sp. 2/2-37]
MFQEDTIAAVATAVGEGGIGIIRMSGIQALAIADNLFKGIRGKKVADIQSYQAAYGHIIDPASGQPVDEVLLLVMRAPNSYTKEDVVEIHCHGGPVPLKHILELAISGGARLAEPGEFTKRAFLNGRLDLTQAEAVIDVIRSKTDVSLRMAVNHLAGSLSERIQRMRQIVLGMIAQLEAAIDFPEEDIEELTARQVAEQLFPLQEEVDELLKTAHTGRILREGLATVIIGKPNVGKSSLLNALLKENRAIVTDIPGTTRDIIEEYVNIRGIPLKIVDTAGIRQTADVVEQIGVDRAREFISRADLILLLLDVSVPLSEEDYEVLQLLQGRDVIILLNKTDLPAVWQEDKILEITKQDILKISVNSGAGLQELEEAIVNKVYSGQVTLPEGSYINNIRQANLLAKAREHLLAAQSTITAGMPPDCIVVDLRGVWERLGEITGDAVNEDIISEIFSQFCIGK